MAIELNSMHHMTDLDSLSRPIFYTHDPYKIWCNPST